MVKSTTTYSSEHDLNVDSVTLSRRSRDIIISHPKWELLDYVEGHYVQAKRRTGLTTWSILMSIRIEGSGDPLKTIIFAETFGKGPVIKAGLNTKLETEIVSPILEACR